MDITYALVGLILILFFVAGKVVWPYIQAHTTAEQLNVLTIAAQTAVFAAEKMLGPKMGKDKLAYAIERVKELLAPHNVTFNEEVIRAAIEAQVKQLDIETKPEENHDNVC